MRHRIAALAMAAVAFLGTGVVAAAGPAQATTPRSGPPAGQAHAAPALASGAARFYLYQSGGHDSNCIVTNGVGNQLTLGSISDSYCARIYVSFVGISFNYNLYQFSDGNGNCLRGNSANVVKVESGACNTSDQGETWALTSCVESPPGSGTCATGYGSRYRWENMAQSEWLKTDANSSGWKVWVGFDGYNEWDPS